MYYISKHELIKHHNQSFEYDFLFFAGKYVMPIVEIYKLLVRPLCYFAQSFLKPEFRSTGQFVPYWPDGIMMVKSFMTPAGCVQRNRLKFAVSQYTVWMG